MKLQCRHVNYCVLCLMSVGGLQETRSDHQERTPISCPMFNTSAVWIFFFFFTPHYFTRPVVATRPPEKKKGNDSRSIFFFFSLSLLSMWSVQNNYHMIFYCHHALVLDRLAVRRKILLAQTGKEGRQRNKKGTK